MKPPIFIVGANRSGTTLLRLILNAHSNIAIPDELQYFNYRLGEVPIETWRNPSLTPNEYRTFVRHFLRNVRRCLPGIDVSLVERDVCDKPPYDLRKPYEDALRHWARCQGKVRWGEKTPGNLFYADVIIEMFPDARFLYMARDPRAGVHSMQEVSFFPKDVVFNAFNRRKHNIEGRAVLRRHVPRGQQMMVRFEDLVTDFETTVREICGFLDEPFEPQMLSFHESASRFMTADAATSFNVAATSPISTEKKDVWRAHLTKDQVALVEWICRDEMQEFGYVPDGAQLRIRQRIGILIKGMYWNEMCRRYKGLRQYTVRHVMFARLRNTMRRAVA